MKSVGIDEDEAVEAVQALVGVPNGFAGLDADGNIVGTAVHRTGTAAELASVVMQDGEIAVTTDTQVILLGDGSTAGGVAIGGVASTGGTFSGQVIHAPGTSSLPGMAINANDTGVSSSGSTANSRTCVISVGGQAAISIASVAGNRTVTFNGSGGIVASAGAIGSVGFLGGGTIFATNIATAAFAISASATPASASATGTAGSVSWDANYIYVCVATNTWKRAAISTW